MAAPEKSPKGYRLAGYVGPDAESDPSTWGTVRTAELGPQVPLMSNSPTQWIAIKGMMLRARIGSEIQGLSTGPSDIDEMGICIEPPQTVIGSQQFKTYTYRTRPQGVTSGPGDLDLTVYSLRHFAHLARTGNPTVLMLLFVPPKFIQFRNPYADELFERRHMFLSREAGEKFKGYLHSQREGLLGHRSGGTRNQGRADIRAKYGFDTKFAAHMVRLGIQGVQLLTTGTLTLPIPEPHRTWLQELRRGEHSKEEALARAARLHAQITELIPRSPLPEHPDHVGIDQWMATVHKRFWRW